jgi:hypothetical protein
MTKCDFCGKTIEGMPFTCRRCKGDFCGDHRLPEYHNCRGLKRRSPVLQQVTKPAIREIQQKIKPPTNPILEETVSPVMLTPNPKKIDGDIDNIPREKLREIVKTYGETIIDNPKRLRALLSDYCCGGNKREINAIISSLEERIPHEILKSKNTVPLNILLPQLKKRLSENTYYSDDLVAWSIKTWILAFGIQNLPQK